MSRKNLPDLKPVPTDGTVTAEELRATLVDGGYSADERMDYLKEVLTQLSAETADDPTGERGRLIGEVKEILADEQGKENASPQSDRSL